MNVVKIMPETAIKVCVGPFQGDLGYDANGPNLQFGAYEAAKRSLAQLEGHDDAGAINPYSKFVAGGIAGMIAQFSVYPLDTLKFR